jgi:hypothetical protein
MKAVFQFLQGALKVVGRFYNTPGGRAVIQNLPRIAREVDSWISIRSYEKACARVDKLEKEDRSLLNTLYEQRKADMSPEVRRAFEEAINRQQAANDAEAGEPALDGKCRTCGAHIEIGISCECGCTRCADCGAQLFAVKGKNCHMAFCPRCGSQAIPVSGEILIEWFLKPKSWLSTALMSCSMRQTGRTYALAIPHVGHWSLDCRGPYGVYFTEKIRPESDVRITIEAADFAKLMALPNALMPRFFERAATVSGKIESSSDFVDFLIRGKIESAACIEMAPRNRAENQQ